MKILKTLKSVIEFDSGEICSSIRISAAAEDRLSFNFVALKPNADFVPAPIGFRLDTELAGRFADFMRRKTGVKKEEKAEFDAVKRGSRIEINDISDESPEFDAEDVWYFVIRCSTDFECGHSICFSENAARDLTRLTHQHLLPKGKDVVVPDASARFPSVPAVVAPPAQKSVKPPENFSLGSLRTKYRSGVNLICAERLSLFLANCKPAITGNADLQLKINKRGMD